VNGPHCIYQRFRANLVAANDDSRWVDKGTVCERGQFGYESGSRRELGFHGGKTERDGAADAAAGADHPESDVSRSIRHLACP
jgi:hypothetical protein